MKNLWEKWKVVAEKIGNFQAGLLFSILYFILVTPVGLIASLFQDFLAVRKFPKWQEMKDTASTLSKMKNQ